jgi:hypothetical protein
MVAAGYSHGEYCLEFEGNNISNKEAPLYSPCNGSQPQSFAMIELPLTATPTTLQRQGAIY